MSTAVEDAQDEQPVTSSAQTETIKTEEGAPASKADDVDVKAESPDAKKNGFTEKETRLRTYDEGELKGVLKTSAHEDPTGDRRKNSKYDPSILPETDDPSEIRRQVEFYFGDSNLPFDNNLWIKTGGPLNLPVKVAHICEFGRMKRFKPISAVVPALRDSEFLEITGPEGLEEIKRKYPYDPDSKRPKSEPRSIYAKGFGDEEPSSQFDIEAFFSPYGPINSVRLRRTDDKLFKGSVFVEFQDVETANKFLELDPKPLWKGEHILKIMPKKQYQDEKVEEIRDGKIRPGPTHTFRGRGRGRGDRGGNRGRNDRDRGGRDRRDRDRGDRDPDDWKKRREDDRANGFRDDRNGRDHKGGRGRGRGRHDRGPRDNDRNRQADNHERNADDTEKKVDSKPEDTAEEPKADIKKRAREDDGGEGAPSKKVDSKPDITTESS